MRVAQISPDGLVTRYVAGRTPLPNGWTAASYIDLMPLADLLAERIATVKTAASERILAIAPLTKQANLTARAAELALVYPGVRGVDLPEPARSEYLVGQAIRDRINAIRDASNQIEAQLAAAATDRAALLAVDVGVGWPD